ncbi:MAG: DUF418 domain-containing protein [Planctomycetes bacterium]|nr:DUF418 domain-containing protein [Planctomycetota bacterium]
MTLAEHEDLLKSASHVQEGSESEVSGAPPPALLPQPTTSQERVAALDVLRGFAILGILLVNMAVFNSPLFYFLADIQLWPGTLDSAVRLFIRFFAESKFYSMFSFLFGLGFCIQMERARERGGRFGGVYVRRLVVLLLLGQAHAHLIWNGDILTFYAVLGFVLFLFRNRSPKTLLIWAVVFLLLPLLFNTVLTVLVELGRTVPEVRSEIDAQFAQVMVEFKERGDEALEVYTSGSFLEIMRLRRAELFSFYGFLLFILVPNVLAMFLIGMYVGRRSIHRDITGHLPLIKKVAAWGLVWGVLGNATYTFAMTKAQPALPSFMSLLAAGGIMVGAPAMCLAYVCGLTLLVQIASWRRRLAPIAAVGRMALTNYLLQSVICTAIFYSYGLGLYGRCSSVYGLLLTLTIYGLQIPFSVWWLRRYRFGPLEWVWRSLTYAQRQPMRRPQPPAV